MREMANVIMVDVSVVFGFLIVMMILVDSVTNSGATYTTSAPNHHYSESSLNRSSFPSGFIFGAASSSYQYEGAVRIDGRGPSIWDTFTHKFPDKITDHSNGDVALDSYHRYKEDVRLVKEMGMDAYRFSISWSRILPNGKLNGGVNKEGTNYYNNLIDEILCNGLQPFVTLFHWDLPQILEDEYGGFLSPRIVNDFKEYAELCYKEFGDRVKHWITINEPWTFSNGGYAMGSNAPGRCSKDVGDCQQGNSGTEPYVVAQNLILAHAAAVRVYKDKYQKTQEGKIGIALISNWMVPFSNSELDHRAAQRAIDFMLGWFMDPLVHGDYPSNMRSLVKNRLPKFTREQSEVITGSFDFIGLNYYTGDYASHVPSSGSRSSMKTNPSYTTDSLANITTERNGVSIGPKTGSKWFRVYPRGIKDVLVYIKRKYGNPVIYITENGVPELNDDKLSREEAMADTERIDFHASHLSYIRKAIKEGVDVRGYFVWSLLDNFEWSDGYTVRFGLNYVDYKDGLKRYPKHSAIWFKKFFQNFDRTIM